MLQGFHLGFACSLAGLSTGAVQVQDRDPDAVMDILEDWTDMQLENFFRDLVAAMNQVGSCALPGWWMLKNRALSF
jgi:hypothetical protein